MYKISKISGEFIDDDVEDRFQQHQWPQLARQLRIVNVICMLGYAFSYYANYLDLGATTALLIVVLARLPAITCQAWIIAETFCKRLSLRVHIAVFLLVIACAISEAFEFSLYLSAVQSVDPLTIPFFAIIILIVYAFSTTRFWWTTYASLIGSVIVLAPRAIGVADPAPILIRHSLILFGIIVFGAGLIRIFNKLRRSDWMRQQALEAEIVERQRAEQTALQANAVKDEFLASVSHELRNPLHAILGTTKLLQVEKLDDHTAARIALIEQAGNSLLTQVNGLLEFVQFSHDDRENQLLPFQLRQLLNATSHLMQGMAHEKHTNISIQCDEQLHDYLLGDAEKIRQILLNLLSNAIKYGNASPIRLLAKKQDADTLALIVEDDGGGVPKEFEAALFTNFSRHSEHKYTISGIGLGLAISRKLAQSMDGQLSYEAHAKGARFSLSIPLVVDKHHDDTTALTHQDTIPTTPAAAARTILLIEDDPIVRGVTRDLLQSQGHQILQAATAQAATEMMLNETVDLIISDLNLPGTSGVELLQALRDKGFNTPALILTANALMEQENTNTAQVYDAVLIKPLSLSRLNKVLAELDKKNPPVLVNERFLIGELRTLDKNTIDQLRSSVSSELMQLHTRLGALNGSPAADLLHSMASVASNLGLSALQAYCADLETKLRRDQTHPLDHDGIADLIRDSLAAADRVIAASV